MSSTGTTKGAREHARAQAGTSTQFQPTIPPRGMADPPAGVAPEQLLWADVLGPGDYAARALPRGATVQLVDVDGDACASVLVYNALRPIERLNVADTVKVQWQAYLGVGSLLLSDMGRVLMSMIRDTGGAHDALCGCSNERRNGEKYGAGGAHGPYPNARDRFAVALSKYGLERRDLAPNINFFKGARVSDDGALAFAGDASAPGATVELRAELPVLFAVVNAPHVLDPRPTYTISPLRVTAWRGEPTGPNDPLWTSSPEAERAFVQTEDFQ